MFVVAKCSPFTVRHSESEVAGYLCITASLFSKLKVSCVQPSPSTQAAFYHNLLGGYGFKIGTYTENVCKLPCPHICGDPFQPPPRKL